LAQALVDAFRPPLGAPHPIEEIALVPAGKGMYEIFVDGKLVYSKKQTGQHIADDKAVDLVKRAS
jgi:selT/selW/selH-like putative selenoprotein